MLAQRCGCFLRLRLSPVFCTWVTANVPMPLCGADESFQATARWWVSVFAASPATTDQQQHHQRPQQQLQHKQGQEPTGVAVAWAAQLASQFISGGEDAVTTAEDARAHATALLLCVAATGGTSLGPFLSLGLVWFVVGLCGLPLQNGVRSVDFTWCNAIFFFFGGGGVWLLQTLIPCSASYGRCWRRFLRSWLTHVVGGSDVNAQ